MKITKRENLNIIRRAATGTNRSFLLVLVGLLATAPSVMAAADDTNSSTISGVVSSPAPTRNFSLSACFDKADRDNKDIAVFKWNLRLAEAGVKVASAIPNPQLQVQTGFGPTFIYLFTGQTQQMSLTQQLQTAGKRTKKIDVANATVRLNEIQLDALRFSIHNKIRRAYAELAAAEAYEELIESQRDVALKLLTIAQKRFETGKAPQSEVFQANLNVIQFDTQRNQAKGRLQTDSATLTQLLGDRPQHIEVIDVDDNGIFKLLAEKTEIVPQPTRAVPPLGQILNAAYNSRPDYKAAQQQVFVNQRALILAKTLRKPDLFLGAGFTWATFSKNNPVIDGQQLNPAADWLGSGVFVTLNCENPIFYQYQGEEQQALATLRQSQRQADLLRSQIASDTVVAYNSVNVARANIFKFQDELLPTAGEVAKVARRGFELGATDLATAIVAQQQYQQTLQSYFDAVVAYQTAWADLEQAVGAPLKF